MSSTPNYGYNTRIDAIERIDRDIKRVEDKADRNSEIKVDKADGYGLISKNRLEQITHNQNHIECLSKRIDRADIDIADRYTKSEIKTKLRYKADKCELEKHMIDPQAHGELCDGKVDKLDGHGLISQEQLAQIEINKNDISRMYTQAEVDELLSTKANQAAIPAVIDNLTSTSTVAALSAAQGRLLQNNKVDIGSPTKNALAGILAAGFKTNEDCYYIKTPNNVVTIQLSLSRIDGGAISGTVATLPVGFRPPSMIIVPVIIDSVAGVGYQVGHIRVTAAGAIIVYAGTTAFSILTNFSFLST